MGAYTSNAYSQDAISQQDAIDQLIQKITSEPTNLDYYFQYAKIAESIGEPEKAVQAYETMLKLDPNLDRVKLDLGMAYLRLQKVSEAKSLFQEVLDRKPPEQVKHNIENALKHISENMAGHKTGGFIQIGFVSDSNPNSAPGNGSVTVFDTSLPLEGASLGQGDVGMMMTAGIQHRYRFETNASKNQWDWNSSLTGYQTLQQDQDQLNLQLVSLRTGPSVSLPEVKMNIGLQGSATIITLDTEHYLDVYSAELTVNKEITPKFSLEPELSIEYRDFHNSTTVTTYEDRTGAAYQVGLTGRYLLTERDLLDANVSWRREDTQKGYYNNQQFSASMGYSHMFEQGFFTNLRGGLRRSLYGEADLFISARTRSDFERYGQIVIGKNFENNISASLTYMYRDVDSNLQNYAYDNHRFMGNVSYKF